MPRVFVGNIPHASTERELQQWIENQGFKVSSVQVIRERFTDRPRGFGFVQLAEEQDIGKVVSILHGRRMAGRALTVAPATELKSKGSF